MRRNILKFSSFFFKMTFDLLDMKYHFSVSLWFVMWILELWSKRMIWEVTVNLTFDQILTISSSSLNQYSEEVPLQSQESGGWTKLMMHVLTYSKWVIIKRLHETILRRLNHFLTQCNTIAVSVLVKVDKKLSRHWAKTSRKKEAPAPR